MSRTDILSLDFEGLTEFIYELGEKKFRAKQIFDWLHQKNAKSFEEMSNLSADFREKLNADAFIGKLKLIKRLESSQDGTTKYVFETRNDHRIEAVFMRYSFGNSVCISSQAGCRMGCAFCASTLGGLDANLTSGEMLDQIYAIEADKGERVSSVVVMGCGEPLDNFENLIGFLKILTDENGKNIGGRHITVSTCGLVERIYELAELSFQLTLAISLHAPNDDIRKQIMPMARRYSIESLIKAGKYYGDTTKRRVTYEYAMIDGLNDSEVHANELAKHLRGSLAHVNLIPINEVSEKKFVKSSDDTVAAFKSRLEDRGLTATIRRELGSDISAACGQLRNK